MTAVAVAQFLTGLVVCVAIGFVVGPLIRYWLVWRIGVEVSREEDLIERMQKHLLDELDHLLDESSGAVDEPLPDQIWSSGLWRTRDEPGEPSQRSGMRRSWLRLGEEKPRT